MVNARFLPGNSQVVIAWANGISLHQVENAEEVWFQPLPDPVLAFDLQPQGKVAVVALADGSLALANLNTAQVQLVTGARPNTYRGDVAWSPDGKTIAFQTTGPGRADPIHLYNVTSGEITQVPGSEIAEGVQPVLVWSPDSAWLTVAAPEDECARIIDIHTGKEIMHLGVPRQCYSPYALTWLADGKSFAAQGRPGRIDILQVPTGRRIRTFYGDIAVEPGSLRRVFVDPTGTLMGSLGSIDPASNQINLLPTVWDLPNNRRIAQLKVHPENSQRQARLAAAFDGETVLFLSKNGAITRWSFQQPGAVEEPIAVIPVVTPQPGSLTFSANGSRLALAGKDGGAEIWDLYSQQVVRRFGSEFSEPALNQDGTQIALYNNRIRAQEVYDLDTGAVIHSLPATQTLFGAVFSPDGNLLAYSEGIRTKIVPVGGRVPVILIPNTGDQVPSEQKVIRLLWSPDGQALVSVIGETSQSASAAGNPAGRALETGMTILWKRMASGAFEEVLHSRNVMAGYNLPNLVLATFNSSGSRAALLSLPEADAAQMDVIVYDLQTRQVVRTFRGYRPGAWMNDDMLLAAEAQMETRLTRWNVVTGEKQVGGGHEDNSIAYAPGGLFYLQTEKPPQRGIVIRQWKTGEILARGAHRSLNLVDYRWSSDGHWVASQGDDGSIRVWPVTMK